MKTWSELSATLKFNCMKRLSFSILMKIFLSLFRIDREREKLAPALSGFIFEWGEIGWESLEFEMSSSSGGGEKAQKKGEREWESFIINFECSCLWKSFRREKKKEETLKDYFWAQVINNRNENGNDDNRDKL